LIAHLLPSSILPDAAQWGAIGLTAVGGLGILKRRSNVLDLVSWATFSLGALAVVVMVGVAMLAPAPPPYTLSLTVGPVVTSPVQVTACATKLDGSATTTPDKDHVLGVLIDGAQVATESTSSFAVTATPGYHSLRVELLTRDHREFNPVVAVDAGITVTGVAPATGATTCPNR
jgi:hypothetical protein